MSAATRQRERLTLLLAKRRAPKPRASDRVVAPEVVRDALGAVWCQHDHPTLDELTAEKPTRKMFAGTAKVLGVRPMLIARVLRRKSLQRRMLYRVENALFLVGALKETSR